MASNSKTPTNMGVSLELILSAASMSTRDPPPILRTPLDPSRSTIAPMTAAIILFNFSGLITISLLYRIFHLVRGRHHLESGLKFFKIPLSDVLLLVGWVLMLQVTVWGTFVGEDCTEVAKGFIITGRELVKDSYVFRVSALVLQFVSKIPLYLSFFHAITYFPPARWLRILITVAPVYHVLAFLAALILEILKVGDQIGMLVFAVSTDVVLLLITTTLLLNPVLYHLSLPIQRLLATIFYTLGLFSLFCGILRFVYTRPGLLSSSKTRLTRDVLNREEAGLLWLALQTATMVVVGNAVTFKDVLEERKEDVGVPGAGKTLREQRREQRSNRSSRREQVGIGVWREGTRKGKRGTVTRAERVEREREREGEREW